MAIIIIKRQEPVGFPGEADPVRDISRMDVLTKIVMLEELESQMVHFRKTGKKVVFTNGCFDLLHLGHVRYLAAAKSEGHILVVGLNSDESVKKIKGDKRPIVEQAQRAEVLASLWCVDYVTIFDEEDPLRLIETLKPDVLVKGEDWGEKEIVGADLVKRNGGRVIRATMIADASTSSIIQRIVERYQKTKGPGH